MTEFLKEKFEFLLPFAAFGFLAWIASIFYDGQTAKDRVAAWEEFQDGETFNFQDDNHRYVLERRNLYVERTLIEEKIPLLKRRFESSKTTRKGHWVKGYYRDGYWVEGHYRSGSSPETNSHTDAARAYEVATELLEVVKRKIERIENGKATGVSKLYNRRSRYFPDWDWPSSTSSADMFELSREDY